MDIDSSHVNVILVLLVITSTMMTSQLVSGAPINRTDHCSQDYWNDPCNNGDRPTDAPPTSKGAQFFKETAALFRFLNKCLGRRKEEYIDARQKDLDYLSYLDANLKHLDGMPSVPDYTMDLKNKEEEVIRNATRNLVTIAVFNELIVIDEIATEAPSSPFAKYFQEMQGYYQDNLCRLREEMRARRMAPPACQDLSVIPLKLRQQQDDRSSRHDRDYFIMRDSQKIIVGHAMQFARIYAQTAPKN